MFSLHSLTGRIAVGKLVGLLMGLVVLLLLPLFDFPLTSHLGLGTLAMFILMGAMIGCMGIFTKHPIGGIPLPWCVRGFVVGFAFFLMFILFNYQDIQIIMQSRLVAWTGLTSPWWALIDGSLLGMFMAYIVTKISGEGANLPIQ